MLCFCPFGKMQLLLTSPNCSLKMLMAGLAHPEVLLLTETLVSRPYFGVKFVKFRSTVYHPQTDGQSEALNRVIEDYLRAYTTEDQTAWARLLPLAQFAYNNSRNHTTHMSPNRLLHGFDCEIRIDIADNVAERSIPAAKDHVKNFISYVKAFLDD